MERNKIIILIVVILAILSAIFIPSIFAVVADSCCEGFCIFNENSCTGANSACEISDCETGCCMDEQGFVHNKYPDILCINSGGTPFGGGECASMDICR